MYNAVIDACEFDSIARYRVQRDGHQLPFSEVLGLWQTDHVFQEYFSALLADAPSDGFRWETPSLTRETTNRVFEFVLVNTPEFASRVSDRETYSEYFCDTDQDSGIVSFPNIRGDATLVVPSPRGEDGVFGHLAAFVRGAEGSGLFALACPRTHGGILFVTQASLGEYCRWRSCLATCSRG